MIRLEMKNLKELLVGLEIEEKIGNDNISISKICFDTREIVADSVFVAQKGTKVDGHQFIDQAIEKGATCIFVEDMPGKLQASVCYIKVKSTSRALAIIAANFYDRPSEKLHLVGITGTNGKTTTVTLLYRLFMSMGKRVGLLSTIENRINDEIIASTHTTPDSVKINELLHKMVEAGCEYCFMEVSSHSIVQDRVTGLQFSGGIFSNLTHDHLDYHKTFAQYRDAKKMFFDHLPKTAFALTNMDDPNGLVMLQNTIAGKYTYSLQSGVSDFKAKVMECNLDGIQLNIGGEEVWFKLVGKFNAYNLLAIYSTAVLLGMDSHETLVKMSMLEAAEGRFFTIQDKKLVVVVDYAHTPDALQNVLETINAVTEKGQDIITVVGCGGDRDKTKRPEMAEIACRLSNRVILTSDNPRTEEPEAILADMEVGVSSAYQSTTLTIVDRHQAIKTAILTAKPNSIVLIAGKGHEKYQDIQGVKHHFDDVEEARKYLNMRT